MRITHSLAEKGEHITHALGQIGDNMIDQLGERGGELLDRLEIGERRDLARDCRCQRTPHRKPELQDQITSATNSPRSRAASKT